MLKGNLGLILEDSRSTLDKIVAKENLKKRDDKLRNKFDPAQVRVNPELMKSLDAAHTVLDLMITNA